MIQIRIIGEHPRRIRRHHQISLGRNHGVAREGEVDAGGEPPSSEVHAVGALVVELHEFIVIVSGYGAVHDLIDDDVMHTNGVVGGCRRASPQWMELFRPVRIATCRDAGCLSLETDRIQHPRTIGAAEVDGFAAGTQTEIERVLVEHHKPARRNARARRNDKLVRARIIRERAAGEVHRLIRVVIQLDEIHVGQLGIGEELVDHHRSLRSGGLRIKLPGRATDLVADTPRIRIALTVGRTGQHE